MGSLTSAVPPILAAIPDVLAPVATILQPVPPVLAAVADVFQAIAKAAIDSRIASILEPIAAVFAAVANVLAAIASILTSIANVLQPITDLSARSLRRLRGHWYEQYHEQANADRGVHVTHGHDPPQALVFRPAGAREVKKNEGGGKKEEGGGAGGGAGGGGGSPSSVILPPSSFRSYTIRRLKEYPLPPQPASRAALHARLIKLEKLLRTECFANEPMLHGRGHRQHCYWCEAAADAHDAAEALAPHAVKPRSARKSPRRPVPLRTV